MRAWNGSRRPVSPILAFVLLACLCVGFLVYDSIGSGTSTIAANVVVAVVLALLFGIVINRLLHDRWDVGTAFLAFTAPAVAVTYIFGPETVLRSDVAYVFWVLILLAQFRMVEPDAETLTEAHGSVLLLNGVGMATAGWIFHGGLGVIIGVVLAFFGLSTVSDIAG